MGLTDLWSDFLASVSMMELHAEAPAEDEKKDEDAEEGSKGGEDSEEKDDEKKDGGEEEEGDKSEDDSEDSGEKDEEEGEEEEEEEEEEEPEDPKPKIEEECARSAQCAPMKHHYDDCVKRVTAKEEDENYKGPKEDCVEEFFHLQHCATQCAAPKLFRLLK